MCEICAEPGPSCPFPNLVAKLEEAERLASLVDTAELAIKGLAAAKAKLEAAEKMAQTIREYLAGCRPLDFRAALAAWESAGVDK